ncbi:MULTISPECIES: tautomerase family protein [Sphingobacterium]|uniref:tautomerase family protein n=1 Tax=Sphingobacterium TaxID=28453 RepID=UPI0010443A64|nr:MULTISPECIES: tautomerase family protein [Sphingobacterium]MCW2259801.1 phenylpyruvate tautomerase PptA (4-oxalocrotonate tautomerase family) [Sphingobacterium kitahiroshimense]TCR03359.1 tautomerase-like protein [Sphingobacterium sp. JUb78]
MPFVRISLPKVFSQQTKDNISISVHNALIQEFNIPKNDYFHIIEELEPQQIKFPENYLDIAHTSDIVYIQIIAGHGRTLEQKKGLYKEIANKITTSTSITKNNIIIVLLENDGRQNWSFGNGEIQEPKHL